MLLNSIYKWRLNNDKDLFFFLPVWLDDVSVDSWEIIFIVTEVILAVEPITKNIMIFLLIETRYRYIPIVVDEKVSPVITAIEKHIYFFIE
jgi:hypothetical protein